MQLLVILWFTFVLAIADRTNRILPYSAKAKEYGGRLVREYSKEQNLEGRLKMLDVLKFHEKPLYTPEASDNSCLVDDAFILNGTLIEVHEKEDQFAFSVVHDS
ncbi:hypothetical protein M3Y96_00354100 [Aphelenchoides besseyi]|nr:hypothetical protein M3Y96_00354100 [Aphelenchoides besseyi]